MMRRVDDIEAIFSRVKASAERVMGGEESAKDQSFQEIFELNNEIGKLGRQIRKTMPRMKEIQAYVNMITVGIKYDRMGELREGLALTEESIKSLRREFSLNPDFVS